MRKQTVVPPHKSEHVSRHNYRQQLVAVPVSKAAVILAPHGRCIAQLAAKIDQCCDAQYTITQKIVFAYSVFFSHTSRNFTQPTGVMYIHSQQQKEA